MHALLSTTGPDHGTQALLFMVSFILLVVGAVLSGIQRAVVMCLLCSGLAAFVLVFAWTQLALS